jgi:hypothetical protein
VTDFIPTKDFSKRRTVEVRSSKTCENLTRQGKKERLGKRKDKGQGAKDKERGRGRRFFPVEHGVPEGTKK